MSLLPISSINKMIKNQASLYNILSIHKNLYLPERDSRAVTDQYLLDVLQDKVFIISRNHMKFTPKPLKNLTVFEMIEILKNLAEEKPLGFDLTNPPNKQWLIDVIFALDSNNSMFKLPEEPTRLIDAKYI